MNITMATVTDHLKKNILLYFFQNVVWYKFLNGFQTPNRCNIAYNSVMLCSKVFFIKKTSLIDNPSYQPQYYSVIVNTIILSRDTHSFKLRVFTSRVFKRPSMQCYLIHG